MFIFYYKWNYLLRYPSIKAFLGVSFNVSKLLPKQNAKSVKKQENGVMKEVWEKKVKG